MYNCIINSKLRNTALVNIFQDLCFLLHIIAHSIYGHLLKKSKGLDR